MARRRLRIGTRTSRLALVQVDLALAALLVARPDLKGWIDVIKLDSVGDRRRDVVLEAIGGRGVFTDDVDMALANGDVDIAIHAMKDVPVFQPDGILTAAMLKRADPREALVSARHTNLADVPEGGVFGSASHRRVGFLQCLRPDLRFDVLRGNVEERVAAVSERPLDGTILAVAGLARLGMEGHIRQVFSPSEFPPDPGQGAIGLACRTDDLFVRRVLADINHTPTFAAVTAERAMLAAVDHGCAWPLGGLATVNDGILSLFGTVLPPDAGEPVRVDIEGPAHIAEDLGLAVGARLSGLGRQWVAA